MKYYEIPLHPDGVYHIVNHANGKEKLFLNRGNYLFFLKRYQYFIEPIAETVAYCLMPNHFHFLLKIKDTESLQDANRLFKRRKNPRCEDVRAIESDKFPTFISRTFGNLFSSYAQAFNKQQKRRGSLFIPNFKRAQIDSENYFRNAVRYIHYNPVKHGFVDHYTAWEFSSYSAYISEKESRIARSIGIEMFDGKTSFLKFHDRPVLDLPETLEPDF